MLFSGWLQKMLWFGRNAPTPPEPVALERELRAQIAEMEREVNTFNEAFGHLRAALTHSTSNETEAFSRLQEIDQLAVTVWEEQLSEELGQALHLAREESRLAWTGFSVQSHVLRTLYNQLMEAKRHLLRHWDDLLRQQIKRLPPERQKSLQTLLADTLQGLIVVGVDQAETHYQESLQSLQTARQKQQHPLPQSLTRGAFYETLQRLSTKLSPKGEGIS